MANTVNHFTRKYLTGDEISYIISEMLKHDDVVKREVAKIGIVAQLLVKELVDLLDNGKFEDKFKDCDDVYDYVMEKGIDLTKIVNYEAIDRLYNEEVGINKILKDFVKDFEDKISKSLEGINLDEAVKQLKDISENHEKIIDMPNKK